MVFNLKLNISKKTLKFLGCFGVFLACAGLYFEYKAMPDIITDKIWEMKVLKENTQQWDMFKKMPFPFTFKVYLFDIKNPEEIMQGAKPIVIETGPFVYKVHKWNSDIKWEGPDDISYYAYTRFEFDEEASGRYTEDYKLTILNTPYLGMLLKVADTQAVALPMVEEVLPDIFKENDGLFIRVKVKDYLFDGLRMCENEGEGGDFAAGLVCKQVIAQADASKNLRVENKSVLFANLHYKNNTHLGRFTIKAGIKNRDETAHLALYNNQSYSTVWEGEKSICNKIEGLTTTVFPVNIEKGMIFESFAEDICRRMTLTYKMDETVKGLKGYKFTAANDSFSSKNENNTCYCNNKSTLLDGHLGCVKDGITDLSTCTGGPVMVSFPHLLYADKEYLNSVDGLHPDSLKHESFVILEPFSGFPLSLAQRIQFNIFLRPIENSMIMANVSRALLPLIWIEETLQLDDEFTDMLKNKLFKTLDIVNIIKWVGVSSGAACVLFAIFLAIYNKDS